MRRSHRHSIRKSRRARSHRRTSRRHSGRKQRRSRRHSRRHSGRKQRKSRRNSRRRSRVHKSRRRSNSGAGEWVGDHPVETAAIAGGAGTAAAVGGLGLRGRRLANSGEAFNPDTAGVVDKASIGVYNAGKGAGEIAGDAGRSVKRTGQRGYRALRGSDRYAEGDTIAHSRGKYHTLTEKDAEELNRIRENPSEYYGGEAGVPEGMTPDGAWISDFQKTKLPEGGVESGTDAMGDIFRKAATHIAE